MCCLLLGLRHKHPVDTRQHIIPEPDPATRASPLGADPAVACDQGDTNDANLLQDDQDLLLVLCALHVPGGRRGMESVQFDPTDGYRVKRRLNAVACYRDGLVEGWDAWLS